MSRGEESRHNGLGSPRTGRADSRLCGRDAFSVACPASGFAFGGDPCTLANCATARTASGKPHPCWYITIVFVGQSIIDAGALRKQRARLEVELN